jgi:molybdopterin-guanine dinucleotide biosynthesis protein A
VGFVLERLRSSPGHDAVVPQDDEPLPDGTRRLHPLCGAVRVIPAGRAARALLRSGQRAARALLLELPTLAVPVAALPEPRVVEACNTPQQWARAVAALQGRAGGTRGS